MNYIANKLRDCQRLLLTTHVNPDGDGIGSQLALYHGLRSLGKDVHIHNRDGVPHIYNFLNGSDSVTSGEYCDWASNDNVCAVITLDCGAKSRLGLSEHFFTNTTVINIDHHRSNHKFGDMNIVDTEACSTGVIIYRLLQLLDVPLNFDISSALYATLVTDTNCFRLSNTDAAVHHLAAEFVAHGARPNQISMNIYEQNAPSRLALLAMSLQAMSVDHDGCVAWLYVNDAMLLACQAQGEQTEGFIDYGRSLAGVEVSVFMRPGEQDTSWRVTFRGKTWADVGSVAASLGGGGHKYAAGCLVHGDFNSVHNKVCTAVEACLSKG
ncbi:MAG: bifunctional oligoribonuclease/PAP phosphatase NrnA [Mariprofundales bacterium]